MVKIMPGIEQEDQSFRVLDQLSLNNLLSLSYHRLPQQLLNLSILKLDGSSFEVNVARNATIADLKQAVEEIFSLSQKDCEGKISWYGLQICRTICCLNNCTIGAKMDLEGGKRGRSPPYDFKNSLCYSSINYN
ncbi:hypothetical protein CsSME_00052485 [Camellia sinensis var. sinensis]